METLRCARVAHPVPSVDPLSVFFGGAYVDPWRMINLRRSGSLLFAIVALTLACGDDDGVAPPAACTGSVDVTVASGTTPTFSWSPRCGIGHLVVGRVIDEFSHDIVWHIASDASTIASPVTYGVARRGQTVINAPEPLIAGTEYRILLTPPGEGPVPLLGGTSFTP
jgi:hypothetical protein